MGEMCAPSTSSARAFIMNRKAVSSSSIWLTIFFPHTFLQFLKKIHSSFEIERYSPWTFWNSIAKTKTPTSEKCSAGFTSWSCIDQQCSYSDHTGLLSPGHYTGKPFGVIFLSVNRLNPDIFSNSYRIMSDKSRKAIFGIERKVRHIQNLSPSIMFDMLDIFVRPIFAYGSDAWVNLD